MDVRPLHLPQLPPSAARRALDVTATDIVGLRQSGPAAARPSAAPSAALTSTQELAALLSQREQEALRARFADLPREGITRPAGYNPRGRTAHLPPAQGRLLDITG